MKNNRKKYKREYYQKNRENAIDKQKKYQKENREERSKYARQWARDNMDKVVKSTKEYREKNPEKAKAWEKVGRGKSYIKLEGLCVRCYKKVAEVRHHPDYSKPLQVQLVCKQCHKEIHKITQSPQRRVFTNSHVLNRVGMVEKTGDTFCLKDKRKELYKRMSNNLEKGFSLNRLFMEITKQDKEFIKIILEDIAHNVSEKRKIIEFGKVIYIINKRAGNLG